MLRSFLFVPGDSARKLASAPGIEADALILDLEDAVEKSRKPLARNAVVDFLRDKKANASQSLWVRVNALDTDLWRQDLAAIVPAQPDGIVLPKASSPRQVLQLASHLDELETTAEAPSRQIGIIPVATETAAAVFQLGEYRPNMSRLRGITWGAEDLSLMIGAHGSRDAAGKLLPVFQHVQALVLLAAGVAGVPAIETLYGQIDDPDGLKNAIAKSRQQGFSGMLAVHPSQVSAINAGFLPTAEEVDQAHRIVEAFANANGAGAIRFDGKMLDQPHLQQARRLLQRSRR